MVASSLQQRAKQIVATAAAVLLIGAAAQAQVRQGDCNDNGEVSIGELVRCANIFNEIAPLANCPSCDQNGDLTVSIGEVVGASNCFLDADVDGDCRVITPPPTATVPPATETPTSPPATATPTETSVVVDTPTPITPATATNTPVTPATNTPIGATNTPVTPPTSTATETPLMPTATNTSVPPTPTATTAAVGAVEFDATLFPGGGTQTSCRGVCVEGANAGMVCTANPQCGTGANAGTCGAMRCTAGANAGLLCIPQNACPGGMCVSGMCNGGRNAGRACAGAGVGNNPCPGGQCTADLAAANTKRCIGGPFDQEPCASGNNCAGCQATPGEGSCAIIQNSVFDLPLAQNGVCVPRSVPDRFCVTNVECDAGRTCRLAEISIAIGGQNPDGTRQVSIDGSKLFLPPADLGGIGLGHACVTASGSGAGTLDCDGGTAGLNFTLSQDHNTSPNACLFGPNMGQPCTPNNAQDPTTPDCPPFPGDAFECINQSCSGGPNMGEACTSSAHCPGRNYPCNTRNSGEVLSGFPDDPMCNMSIDQPSGAVDLPCREGTGTCEGGSNDGAFCVDDDDCPAGGECALCSSTPQHPFVCTSAIRIDVEGFMRPGDMVVVQPLAIALLGSPAQYGTDMLPCTADDMPASPPAAVPVILSTGSNTVRIFDADNISGATIQPGALCGGVPCIASTEGAPIDCATLNSGNLEGALNGLTFGGGFPAFDTMAGDIATTFRFVIGESAPAEE